MSALQPVALETVGEIHTYFPITPLYQVHCTEGEEEVEDESWYQFQRTTDKPHRGLLRDQLSCQKAVDNTIE